MRHALMRRISAFSATVVALFFSLAAISDFYTETKSQKINQQLTNPTTDLMTCIKTYLESGLNVSLNGGEKARELVVAGDIVGVELLDIILVVLLAYRIDTCQ
jgi:hypothetical protein